MKKILILSLTAFVALAPNGARALGALSLEATMQKNAERILAQSQKENPTPPETPQEEEAPQVSEENLIRDFTYTALKETGNIQIFRANESDIFVQEIDLGAGAKVASLLPQAISYNAEVNGGEPEYERKNTAELVAMAGKSVTTVTNGQFFNGNTNPTMLSFGLKSNGEVQSAGADNRDHEKKIITTIHGWTKVLPHSWENLDLHTGDFAIVGLSAEVPNRSASRVGRNYLCPKDTNTRGSSHTLVSLVASEITDAEGIQELEKYGCKKEDIVKLDGGGSARFWYDGVTTYGLSNDTPDHRTIAHGLAFYEE